LEDPSIDGIIILCWIFRKWVVGVRTDRTGSGEGQVVATCEYSNESTFSIIQYMGNFMVRSKPVSFSTWTLLYGVSNNSQDVLNYIHKL
jgi:hypothetical protein